MNRLTERDEYGNADIIGVDSEDIQLNLDFEGFNRVTEALNSLAAYEDTGLEPEQCARYARADIEDKLLVLPCKVGDIVFYAFENRDVFCGKVYAISTCDGTNWFSVRYDCGLRYDHTWDEIGKNVFLTREDAEKALEGMKDDER